VKGNPYIPKLARIVNVRDEAPGIKTFRMSFEDGGAFKFTPGQFIELSVFNYGEAPFSISSSPFIENFFEITVRRMGNVTGALFRLGVGGLVGVRGPFGRGWPIEKMRGHNVLIIGGGIGIAPLKPLIEHIIANRKDYGEVTLFYGARTPKDIVYKQELERWSKHIDVHVTVDMADDTWRGRTGVVTMLFDYVEVDPRDTYSVQCGPPIMMHFVTKKLLELGFPSERIFFSLERLMKCGMGFCGHCMISGRFVCRDGPVFDHSEVEVFLEPAV